MKKLFCVVGRTGTGKDSLVDLVCSSLGMKKVKSYTTRERRPGEGDDSHVFIKPVEIDQFKGKMAAYTKIGEVEYFATVEQVLEGDFYVIDPNGLDDFRERWDFNKFPISIVVIYVTVPKMTQLSRLLGRGDNTEKSNSRMLAENNQFGEFEIKQRMDYTVVNSDLEQAVLGLQKIVLQELSRKEA